MEHTERRQKMKHFSFVVHICLSWDQETIIIHLEHLKAPQGWQPRLGQYLLTCGSPVCAKPGIKEPLGPFSMGKDVNSAG